MGFIQDAITELSEQMLAEDKMVKYDGEISPKFGWCVIYIGGPASGKSTATNHLSRLHGDYYNVDNLKEIKRMWDITDPRTGKPHKDGFKTPEEERILSNQSFIDDIHDNMKPLGNKWKHSMLHNPGSTEEDRLPNMIFDITGDEVFKISEIIDAVKPKGYKVAILWILTTIERAIVNNQVRERSVDIDTILIPKHENVIKSVEKIFSSNLIADVDEFWVIDSAIDVDFREKSNAYHDAQNVYHIPTTKDGLSVFNEVVARIAHNKNELEKEKIKRGISK